ncbi:MAG: cyanophycin synthetase [Miltoncostaeaceae bacterium]
MSAAERWIAGLDILGMRFGLERMHALLDRLGHPERGVPALHVVGTNGKSSTTRLAAALLGAGGRRAGAYLSPHITTWRERVQVGGEPVGEETFATAVAAVRTASREVEESLGEPVTQFEALTAAAFVALRSEGVDAWVIEAGLGGRHDATNVLAPGAAVALTNVALDHTALLGDSERAIAGEKLAVCPDGHDRLVVGRSGTAGAEAVAAECAARGLRPWWVGHQVTVRAEAGGVVIETPLGAGAPLPLGLAGRVQRDNLAVAVAGAALVDPGILGRPGLPEAVAAVRMPGRLEWFPGAPPVLLDGAHNPAGAEALVEALPAMVGSARPLVGVMSVLGDKDVEAMCAALVPHLDAVVATGSHHPRARAAGDVAAAVTAAGGVAHTAPHPEAALARARELAGARGVVVVAGSLYLLGDLRAGLAAGL